MEASWFFATFPPSRHAIENELRLAFWKAGFGRMWFSCVKDQPPYECAGQWGDIKFNLEWQPGSYVLLKMSQAEESLLKAFESVLKHKPLAAYQNGGGSIVVEWRVSGADARFQELSDASAARLERLD